MPNPALIVSVSFGGQEFLDADIGGCSIRAYLLESLTRTERVEPVAVAAESAAALNATLKPRAELLVVDGATWFPPGTLEGVLQRGRKARACLRIVAPSSSLGGRATPRMLALYVPSGRRGLKPFRALPATSQDRLEQILDPALLRKARRVASTALHSRPAIRVDSYAAVAALEKQAQSARAERALAQGVRIRDPERVHIRGTLECGPSVEIEIDVIFEGHVVLAAGVKVGAHSIIRNSRIGTNTRIHAFSLVDESTVGSEGFIGPYGRVRPGSVIGDRVQIGNYVEIKNSRIGDGSRINHHSFVGDAVLEEQVTIGAGSITCNHDGARTQQTVIERGAYIGSGCNLVAPLRVGAGATIGAGSTVTRDVPAIKLTVARAQQVVVEGWRGPKSRATDK